MEDLSEQWEKILQDYNFIRYEGYLDTEFILKAVKIPNNIGKFSKSGKLLYGWYRHTPDDYFKEEDSLEVVKFLINYSHKCNYLYKKDNYLFITFINRKEARILISKKGEYINKKRRETILENLADYSFAAEIIKSYASFTLSEALENLLYSR